MQSHPAQAPAHRVPDEVQESLGDESSLFFGLPAVYAHVGRLVDIVPRAYAQPAVLRTSCLSDLPYFELQETPAFRERKAGPRSRLAYLIDPTALGRVLEVLKPEGGQVALAFTKLEGLKRGEAISAQPALRAVPHHVMVVGGFGSLYGRLETSHLVKLSMRGLYSEPATRRGASPTPPGWTTTILAWPVGRKVMKSLARLKCHSA